MNGPVRSLPGKPLAWSDADLDALSQVSPQDIAEAQAAWRKDAPRGYADLLDAVVE
jgi:hypothetical protein